MPCNGIDRTLDATHHNKGNNGTTDLPGNYVSDVRLKKTTLNGKANMVYHRQPSEENNDEKCMRKRKKNITRKRKDKMMKII